MYKIIKSGEGTIKYTKWGFPKGNLAKTLRQILYPDLTGTEVETVVVCLLSHLLIENKINEILYRWLLYDAPKPVEARELREVKDKLWENIVEMHFAQKYALLYPFLSKQFSKEAKEIWDINKLRTEIFHGKRIRDAKFKCKPIGDQETAEQIFLSAQFASLQLRKFEELLGSRRVLAEEWAKQLKKLGKTLI